MHLLMRRLEEMRIKYVTAVVEDSGIQIDQLFVHDPDGYMVEIYNCENLPVLPLSSYPLKFLYPKDPILSSLYGSKGSPIFQSMLQFGSCRAEAESVIMEPLVTDVMDISFGGMRFSLFSSTKWRRCFELCRVLHILVLSKGKPSRLKKMGGSKGWCNIGGSSNHDLRHTS